MLVSGTVFKKVKQININKIFYKLSNQFTGEKLFMACLIIVGTQWGDEGKGKVVDLLTERGDAVVRYQGGNNAGHTVMF